MKIHCDLTKIHCANSPTSIVAASVCANFWLKVSSSILCSILLKCILSETKRAFYWSTPCLCAVGRFCYFTIHNGDQKTPATFEFRHDFFGITWKHFLRAAFRNRKTNIRQIDMWSWSLSTFRCQFWWSLTKGNRAQKTESSELVADSFTVEHFWRKKMCPNSATKYHACMTWLAIRNIELKNLHAHWNCILHIFCEIFQKKDTIKKTPTKAQ